MHNIIKKALIFFKNNGISRKSLEEKSHGRGKLCPWWEERRKTKGQESCRKSEEQTTKIESDLVHEVPQIQKPQPYIHEAEQEINTNKFKR
jgi:hypothetical protein